MKGGEQKQTQEVKINEDLRRAGEQALTGAENIYGQGTSGIYQGTQLASQDPLVRQAQQQQLAFAGGDLQNLINQQQAGFGGLLSAGNLEGNDVFANQVEQAIGDANVAFQRGSVPIFQQGTATGQYGGSEVGESLGLFGGEVNRNLQNQIANLAQQQQQVGLQAQALAPQALSLGLMPSQIQQDIGNQRTALSQAQLYDEINQFNAPRNAQIQNQSEFQNFLASNPLMGESTQIGTTQSSSDPFQTALGAAGIIGGFGTAGGGTLGGDFIGGLFG